MQKGGIIFRFLIFFSVTAAASCCDVQAGAINTTASTNISIILVVEVVEVVAVVSP